MKTKNILSVIILITFAFLGGGSVETVETLLIVLPIVFVIAIVVAVILENKKIGKQAEIEAMEHAKQWDAKVKERERLSKDYEVKKNAFIEQHGVPDSTIYIKDYNLDEEVIVYEKQKKVFLKGKEYAFKDILSCTFSDNPTTVKGKITSVSVSESKTDNGNALGRAIIGGAIAGPTGAIIGGTTAKQQTQAQTEFNQENDKTYHDYTVIINVNSISNPVIRINTGDNGRLTNEIVGLMNVIISRK